MRLAVVDDDRSMRFLLERALRRLGHEVEAFVLAEEALAALRAGAACDAVVTDQGLPGMDGLGLARELRALRADLPVILLSGHASEELRARAAEAGVLGVLEKPISVKALGEHIDRLLSGKG